MWIHNETFSDIAMNISHRLYPYILKQYESQNKFIEFVSKKLNLKPYQILISRTHFPDNSTFNFMLNCLGLRKHIVMTMEEQQMFAKLSDYKIPRHNLAREDLKRKKIRRQKRNHKINKLLGLDIGNHIQIKLLNEEYLLKGTLKNVQGTITKIYENSVLVELKDSRISKQDRENLNNHVCISLKNIKKEI